MLLWPLRMSCTYSFWSFFVLTKKPLQRPNDSWHFTYHGHWNCFAWDKSLPFRHRFGIYVARARNFWVSFAFGNVHCSCCSVPACFFPVCTVFQILLQLITSFSLILFYRHTLRWALLVILPPTHVTTSQLAHTLPSLCVTLRLPGLLCRTSLSRRLFSPPLWQQRRGPWWRTGSDNRPRESCVRDRTADVRCVDCSGSPWKLESSLSL